MQPIPPPDHTLPQLRGSFVAAITTMGFKDDHKAPVEVVAESWEGEHVYIRFSLPPHAALVRKFLKEAAPTHTHGVMIGNYGPVSLIGTLVGKDDLPDGFEALSLVLADVEID